MENRDLLSELVNKLDGLGARAEYVPTKETLTLLRWDGAELDPPVQIRVDREVLERYLYEMREDAAELWPDSDRVTGALNLLTVHLEEKILTRRPGQTELDLTGGRLEWVD